MEAKEVKFYVYADSDNEVTELNKVLYDFVNEYRIKGIAVKAKSLTSALNKFKDNVFVKQYLKKQ